MSEALIESLEVYLDTKGPETSEITVFEKQKHCETCLCGFGGEKYTIPTAQLTEHSIEENDRFFIDIIQVNGKLTARIRPQWKPPSYKP